VHGLSAAIGLAAALLAVPALAAAGSSAIDFGDPSVMSQRGQKLRLALPYGSAPGERVSASRFEVVSVKAPDGWRAPDPATFTVARPEHRNVVFLTSADAVDAPELVLTVRVADQPDSMQTWRLAMPAPRASTAQASPGTAATERAARRGPTRQRTAAR
jgi:hypothetical protein